MQDSALKEGGTLGLAARNLNSETKERRREGWELLPGEARPGGQPEAA